ncbi:cytochrome c-type biogenesis protein CcmH [Sneathiella marina]|uniref:Cytochrome c-type biogenesis protein n=1 Tax=Sneathiella marina TaxID=2950108 RepID=A0ABY4W401_9PROT|nr:cytochrome c-type biogenesis protein [Sneathiella marina]USG61644.1 cytochrome c-type biogenesis protein CcmH [Sneathiella marina]
MRAIFRSGLVATIFAVLVIASAGAVFVEKRLDDPAQETRAREISEGIRCLVCQNQSILDSNADLARDLRQIIRERIVAGDSDAEVKTFLVVRYGDWVLLDPPFKLRTAILWLGPLAFFLLGGTAVIMFLRGRGSAGDVETLPLTAEEEASFKQISPDDKDELPK